MGKEENPELDGFDEKAFDMLDDLERKDECARLEKILANQKEVPKPEQVVASIVEKIPAEHRAGVEETVKAQVNQIFKYVSALDKAKTALAEELKQYSNVIGYQPEINDLAVAMSMLLTDQNFRNMLGKNGIREIDELQKALQDDSQRGFAAIYAAKKSAGLAFDYANSIQTINTTLTEFLETVAHKLRQKGEQVPEKIDYNGDSEARKIASDVVSALDNYIARDKDKK